jgi:hypothetical protein
MRLFLSSTRLKSMSWLSSSVTFIFIFLSNIISTSCVLTFFLYISVLRLPLIYNCANPGTKKPRKCLKTSHFRG